MSGAFCPQLRTYVNKRGPIRLMEGTLSSFADMTFRERFQRAAAYAKVEWSPTEIGRALGRPKQTVARWMGTSVPPAEDLFLIADRWKINARWLATGDGSMVERVVMEPGAEYRAFTESALEVARGFDQLNAECREHVFRQVQLLRGANPGNGGRRKAAEQDVEIKGGKLQSTGGRKIKKTLR
jgi:hypothetical protein